MKKKIIAVILVLSGLGIIYYVYTLNSSGDTTSPKSYSSIAQLEKELDIEIYQLYDIEAYIENDEKVLLQDSQKDLLFY